MHMSNLGENIRRLRTAKGFGQNEFARMAQIDPGNLSKVERGIHALISPSIERIAATLGVTVAQLLADDHNVVLAPDGFRRIPVLDYVQAGAWVGVAPGFRDGEMQDYILTDQDYSPATFAMVLRGNSMSPEFNEGDRVVIDPSITPHPGDFVVAVNGGGEATFKQYRERGTTKDGKDIFELHPLNPVYKDLRSDEVHIRIVGTMREHHRRFRTR